MSAQPSGRRGTAGHPYSALNLRLALAIPGMIASIILAVLCARAGWTAASWTLAALAAIGAADITVIQLRRRSRRGDSENHHSLFE